MSATVICSTCRFYAARAVPNFAGATGVCRRHAPIGPTMMTQTGRWTTFPPTRADDWCGDYHSIPQPLRVVEGDAA